MKKWILLLFAVINLSAFSQEKFILDLSIIESNQNKIFIHSIDKDLNYQLIDSLNIKNEYKLELDINNNYYLLFKSDTLYKKLYLIIEQPNCFECEAKVKISYKEDYNIGIIYDYELKFYDVYYTIFKDKIDEFLKFRLKI